MSRKRKASWWLLLVLGLGALCGCDSKDSDPLYSVGSGAPSSLSR